MVATGVVAEASIKPLRAVKVGKGGEPWGEMSDEVEEEEEEEVAG